MLRKLLLRDCLVHGRMLLISYGICLAFQAFLVTQVDSARFWLASVSVYAAFLSITMFAREDKFRSTGWTCSLPVSRSGVVKARFVGAWLLVLLCLVAGVILARFMPGSKVDVAGVAEPESLMLAATIITLVVALMLPFMIRFGLVGMMIFLVGAQLLGAVTLLLAKALPQGGGAIIGRGFSAVVHGVRSLHATLPLLQFTLVVVVFLAAMNWAGYRLSVYLFRRREL